MENARRMQAAGRVRADVVRAAQLIGAEGAETAMSDALSWLEGAAEGAEGALDDAMAALNRALIELGEAQQGVMEGLAALRKGR